MIVLDTHVVIWLAQMPEMLSADAVNVIEQERDGGMIGLSDMTLLEIARLVGQQRLRVATSLSDFLQRLERHFSVLPITSSIAARTLTFSVSYPRDPVDRVVGATAVVHGCRLVTKDEAIRASGEVACIW